MKIHQNAEINLANVLVICADEDQRIHLLFFYNVSEKYAKPCWFFNFTFHNRVDVISLNNSNVSDYINHITL